jgi:hypothetical protein
MVFIRCLVQLLLLCKLFYIADAIVGANCSPLGLSAHIVHKLYAHFFNQTVQYGRGYFFRELLDVLRDAT